MCRKGLYECAKMDVGYLVCYLKVDTIKCLFFRIFEKTQIFYGLNDGERGRVGHVGLDSTGQVISSISIPSQN